MEVDLSALPMRVAGVRVIGHTKTKDDVITHFLLGNPELLQDLAHSAQFGEVLVCGVNTGRLLQGIGLFKDVSVVVDTVEDVENLKGATDNILEEEQTKLQKIRDKQEELFSKFNRSKASAYTPPTEHDVPQHSALLIHFNADDQNPVPDAVDVYISLHVKEHKTFSGRIGTAFEGRQGGIEGEGTIRNIRGLGETLSVKTAIATDTSRNATISFDKPLYFSETGRNFRIQLHQLAREWRKSSGYVDEARGLKLEYETHGGHTFGYQLQWRSLLPAKHSSLSTLLHGGHSVKSSLIHTFKRDNRDSNSIPSEGNAIRVSTELAGIGGDTAFIKSEAVFQQNFSLYPFDWEGWREYFTSFWGKDNAPQQGDAVSTSIPIGTNEVDAYQDDDLYDDDDDDDEEGFFSAGGDSNNIVALNLTMSLGAIFSPSLGGLLSRFGRKDGRRSNPHGTLNPIDRFYLGGGTTGDSDLRGFEVRAVGPKEEKDAIGGDLYFSSTANFTWKLPAPIPDFVRMHAYATTGNLLALSTAHSPFSLSHPHSTQLMDIARHTLSTARSSVGMGLVFGLGLGRLELNLCQPLRTGGDAHRSWQVFLAMDFL